MTQIFPARRALAQLPQCAQLIVAAADAAVWFPNVRAPDLVTKSIGTWRGMGRRVGAPSSVRSTSSARRGCHQGPAPRRSASARRWAQTAGWYGNACQRNQSRHHGAGESGRGLFHGRPHDGFGDSRKTHRPTAVSSMVASSSTCPSARKMCSFSLVERAIVWRKSLSSFWAAL